jgi:hypothetical protein
VDLNKDGRITFEEWVQAMHDQRTRGLRAVRSAVAASGPSPGQALLQKRAATLKEQQAAAAAARQNTK